MRNLKKGNIFAAEFVLIDCALKLVGVTKRCRLSWLTNSALVYKPKLRGEGGSCGSWPMSTAVHMEPKYTLEIQLHI